MKLLSKLRWAWWDFVDARLLRTKHGAWIHYEAWHEGWEERSKLGGPPACPSDYYVRGKKSGD